MTKYVTESEIVKMRINENGRIVIPASIREALGVRPGDEVAMRMVDGVLHIEAQTARIRRVQESLDKRLAAGRSLTEELAEERQEEVRQELEEWLG